MSISGISFWRQDVNYWNKSQAVSQSLSNTAAAMAAMDSALTNLATGNASIANQEALTRVNNQIATLSQSASSSSSSGSSASSPSSASIPSSSLASGTGTVPLTTSTSLSSLGIPAQGTIIVSDGTNTTTYTSTGTDTVADLIDAINTKPGGAQATASISSSGKLVISGNYSSDKVVVSGTDASAIGFGAGNNTFKPTNNSPSTPATSSTSSTSNSAAASSSGSSSSSTGSSASTSTGSGFLYNSAVALQTGSSAASLLASSGAGGTLLNLLA